MNRDILEEIRRLSKQTVVKEVLSDKELDDMVATVEAEMGAELSGYVNADKSYARYWNDTEFPRERFATYTLRHCDKYGDKVCIIAGDEKITFNELKKRAIYFADALKKRGVKPGEKIVIQSPSVPDVVALVLGANLIGAVVRPIDPLCSSENLVDFIKETHVDDKHPEDKPATLFAGLDLNCFKYKKRFKKETSVKQMINVSLKKNVSGKAAKVIKPASFAIDKVVSLDPKKFILSVDEYTGIANPLATLEDVTLPYTPDEVCAIYSTSGSSSKLPKGVEITNENLIASVNKQLCANYDITQEDMIFNPMPTHSSYFWDDMVLAVVYGCTTMLSPLFDAENSPKQIIDSKCSIILAGPIIIEKLCDYVDEMDRNGIFVDLGFVKKIISGGDILDIELEQRANKMLLEHGSTALITNAYGTSEKIGPANVPNGVSKTEGTHHLGSVGVPLPGDTVGVFKFDADTHTRDIYSEGYNEGLKYYEIGEIAFLASDADIFKGYYKNEEATAATKVTHTDGTTWYHSEDIGFMDPAGHMFCVGRKSGLIVRAGHKVLASTIVNNVKQINGIEDCAVIGVPDPVEKEVPVLFITFQKNLSDLEKERIKNNINVYLLKKKDSKHVPVFTIELEQIPRNTMQKAITPKLLDIYVEKSAESSQVQVQDKKKKFGRIMLPLNKKQDK